MAKKTIEQQYRKIDHIDHILLRPGTYVGSNRPHITERYIIVNGTIEKREVNYIPSFIKIFDEIITNSVDESKRNHKLNHIKVDIKDDVISIWDNGGMPVVIHKEYGQYVPEVVFGDLMSGSNYDDTEDRMVAGMNGLGAKLTNVFSKKFIVWTCDGKNSFEQEYSDNMRVSTKPIIKKSTKKGTKITFLPDYTQFGLNGITIDSYHIIEKRIWDLAGCNNQIKFEFNDVEIKFNNFTEYVKKYQDGEFFYDSNSDKTWEVIVAPNNGFEQISFINSTDTYDGGTHVDYIVNQITKEIREHILKKYKTDIRPSELKNHFRIFINATIINPLFTSQTKEKLASTIKDFGTSYEMSKKVLAQILKSEIVNSITDWIQQKKEADEAKKIRNLNKNLCKLKVDKLIDAKSNIRNKCSLGIFEGDSALSAFRKYRNPEFQGAFALRGKFANVNGISNAKLMSNVEIINIMSIIGLKLAQKAELDNIRFGKILIYTDADVDGNSIAGLLINFFFTYWPELFEFGIIYKVETPIMVAINKKGKELIYSMDEYVKWGKNKNITLYELKYKKGLAALVDDEYEKIIKEPKLTQINIGSKSKEALQTWFGDDSNLRKRELIS